MPDEYVCQECGYSSGTPGTCPMCGEIMVNPVDEDEFSSEESYSNETLQAAEENQDLDDY